MTGFDIAVLVIVGLAAMGGLMRGFVHEVLALGAWVAALIAIYMFHTPTTELFTFVFGPGNTAGVAAFAALLIVPYLVMRAVARWAGDKTRSSPLGLIDRILGLGFGTIKGLILVVMAFSILALGYDTIWGVSGRPDWISQARSYPFINAASKSLVHNLEEQRRAYGDAQSA